VRGRGGELRLLSAQGRVVMKVLLRKDPDPANRTTEKRGGNVRSKGASRKGKRGRKREGKNT